MDEERRRDREENRQLWRDTQRQLNSLIATLTGFIDQSREADARLERRIDDLAQELREAAQESREADARLGARIESLVSAIGQFITREN
jgi:hypothetical protein